MSGFKLKSYYYLRVSWLCSQLSFCHCFFSIYNLFIFLNFTNEVKTYLIKVEITISTTFTPVHLDLVTTHPIPYSFSPSCTSHRSWLVLLICDVHFNVIFIYPSPFLYQLGILQVFVLAPALFPWEGIMNGPHNSKIDQNQVKTVKVVFKISILAYRDWHNHCIFLGYKFYFRKSCASHLRTVSNSVFNKTYRSECMGFFLSPLPRFGGSICVPHRSVLSADLPERRVDSLPLLRIELLA